MLQTCDRRSCLGCPTLTLQALCYAAQQCALTRCIGTVVNQKNFLCDVGLAMQSMADQSVSMTLGAWLTLTETYADVLGLALDPRRRAAGLSLEWVDDAFFGYVCSAKDMYGQLTSVLTAAVGASIVGVQQGSTQQGGASDKIDNRYIATVSMILNGASAFLYQLALFPLYPLIATQKIFVCTANSMVATVGVSGFTVTLGRADLQNASGTSAGKCMTAYFDASTQDPASPGSQNAIASQANQVLSTTSQTAVYTLSTSSIKFTNVDPKATGATLSAAGKTTAANAAKDAAAKKAKADAAKAASAKTKKTVITRISGKLAGMQRVVPMHYLDATITWAKGAVSGLQDLAQALDTEHCSVPDYYIHQYTTCSCGDDPVTIPNSMAGTTAGSQYWCTGTLRMLDPFGAVSYIYNPYTFAQLRAALSGGRMDAYLRCISRLSQDGDTSVDCSAIEPSDTTIDPQVCPLSQLCSLSHIYLFKTKIAGGHPYRRLPALQGQLPAAPVGRGCLPNSRRRAPSNSHPGHLASRCPPLRAREHGRVSSKDGGERRGPPRVHAVPHQDEPRRVLAVRAHPRGVHCCLRLGQRRRVHHLLGALEA